MTNTRGNHGAPGLGLYTKASKMQIDWAVESTMALRALYAAFLGAFVGWERQLHGHAAGIRTYGAVSLGACVFTLVSNHVIAAPDPTRIAAQVVSGIGFLGAGIIIRDAGQTTGLTTAATVWATAAVGMAVAYNMFVLATLTSLLLFLVLILDHVPAWKKFKKRSNPIDD